MHTSSGYKLLSFSSKSSFFKSLGAIRVDRQGADLTAIKTCFKVLKNNKKLVIFPEGTRNKKDESLQDVKNGSAMIATMIPETISLRN